MNKWVMAYPCNMKNKVATKLLQKMLIACKFIWYNVMIHVKADYLYADTVNLCQYANKCSKIFLQSF